MREKAGKLPISISVGESGKSGRWPWPSRVLVRFECEGKTGAEWLGNELGGGKEYGLRRGVGVLTEELCERELEIEGPIKDGSESPLANGRIGGGEGG